MRRAGRLDSLSIKASRGEQEPREESLCLAGCLEGRFFPRGNGNWRDRRLAVFVDRDIYTDRKFRSGVPWHTTMRSLYARMTSNDLEFIRSYINC